MIYLENICKSYPIRGGQHHVLKNISFTVHPGEKVGILGRNGAGKSTLIRILSGAEEANSGKIIRNMSLSWPLAFSGGFQGSLTGKDNLKFISRIYGADYREKLDFVKDFAELGKFFYEPVKSYSAGMRARLAFAISMAVEFDCFLIDETLAVGDDRFRDKCHYELFEKRKDRGLIIVSHIPEQIRKYCNRIFVLHQGSITEFDDINQAYIYYEKQQQE